MYGDEGDSIDGYRPHLLSVPAEEWDHTQAELKRLREQLGLFGTYRDAHDTLVDIQDWITTNCVEYNDGQLTDLEIIQSIYTRLHKCIEREQHDYNNHK